MKDYIGVIGFFASVLLGAFLINTFLFRSFNVEGPSMEPTLFTGDRLLVNRIPNTLSVMKQDSYRPKRGEVVVFTNPNHFPGQPDEYIVKRVIGLPGERVVVNNGEITVYNANSPEGFKPDKSVVGPKYPTAGQADVRVPSDSLFVAGDNRVGEFSLDSRNGLGTIPVRLLQGPVLARVYPFTDIRLF